VLQQDLATAVREQRKTALYITHDIGEAISLCDRVLVLSRRPASLKAEFFIDLPRDATVIDRRGAPSFTTLFNAIWRELDLDLQCA
jgi:NitT/TauT family transport system ATP-binding protein